MLVDLFENKPIKLDRNFLTHSIKITKTIEATGNQFVSAFYPMKPLKYEPNIMQMFRVVGWGIRCQNKMKIQFRGEVSEEFYYYYFPEEIVDQNFKYNIEDVYLNLDSVSINIEKQTYDITIVQHIEFIPTVNYSIFFEINND